MNVNDTIKEMMLGYPSLYPDPSHALHHLFAVSGNGYDWQNGELVNVCEEIRADARGWIHECMRKAHPLVREQECLHYESLLHQYRFTQENIDRIVEYGNREYTGPLYPMGQFADIVNVPQDVTDDWLNAAIAFALSTKAVIRCRNGEPQRYDLVTQVALDGLMPRLLGLRSRRGAGSALNSTTEE